MTKTQKLQAQVNKIPALEGYKAEYHLHGFYLRHQRNHAIYFPNFKIAEKWINTVRLTGQIRGHDAMRRAI